MAKDFDLGDLVWAKMKGFPPWPAKITEPKEGTPAKSKKPQHFVYFFGTHDVAWILDEFIFPHSEKMLENSNNYKKKSAPLQTAIEEIKVESLNKPPKVVKDKPSTKAKALKTPKKMALKKKIEKKGRKRPASEMIDYSKPGCSKVRDAEDDYAQLKRDAESYAQLIANGPPNNAVDDSPEEPVPASDKSFGFLGLGVMGSIMVKKLLETGHKVTVWNRTAYICEKFIELGAIMADTPAEVIRLCDITFSCLEDAEAVKDVVFQKYGVLEGFASGSSSKGYVEMTTVDPTTSQEICEAISCEGGRYLEAPMIGKRDPTGNSVVILVAGDRQLFNECFSCFSAVSRRFKFFSNTIGFALKIALLANMVYATSLAALAESLSLVAQCGIHPAQFLHAMKGGPLDCELLVNKGKDMISKNVVVEQPIRHMQKDLNMAVDLSNDFDQPTRVTMTVNEVFKRATRMDPDADVSNIYQCYNYDPVPEKE